MNRSIKCLKLFGTVLMLLGLIGCSKVNLSSPSSPNQRQLNAASQLEEKPLEQTKEGYTLQAYDVLDIKFPYEPQLNECVTVRPDGKISLQIVDEIEAAGLTPEQLDNILTEKYSRVLSEPEITVIVREFAGQKVYVGGEVTTPGIVNLKGRMSALEAIFSAGGFCETAEPKSVIVISRSPENTRSIRKVNVQTVLAGAPPKEELLLRPFDVVYVPKTAIAEANKYVDQHIRKMIPINLSAGFSYTFYQDVHR